MLNGKEEELNLGLGFGTAIVRDNGYRKAPMGKCDGQQAKAESRIDLLLGIFSAPNDIWGILGKNMEITVHSPLLREAFIR
jgi:hypothetical protein